MASNTQIPISLSDDFLWQQLSQRNLHGKFIYAVITTGIYCRPGCPSPKPKRDNVRFFNDSDAAERAGFRPCKRCHPQESAADSVITERIARLCRYIETSPNELSLNALATYAGISAYHLQRQFKQVTGVSPKTYARAYREQTYDFSAKQAGARMTIHYTVVDSALGRLLVAATEKGVCAILIGDDDKLLIQDLRRRFPSATFNQDEKLLSVYISQLIALIEEPQHAIQLPLDIRGTLFQQKVWKALQEIPVGETRSYTEIAAAIAAPRAVRAVAGACAANALAIVIPCHRVVRNDGNISGYRWGTDRKKILLQRERDGDQ